MLQSIRVSGLLQKRCCGDVGLCKSFIGVIFEYTFLGERPCGRTMKAAGKHLTSYQHIVAGV